MTHQTIFDIDQPLDKKTPVVTFDLPLSQKLLNIRSILAARKRKSCSSLTTPSSSSTSSVVSSPSFTPASLPSDNKKQKLDFDDMISGLPSPPVDSPTAEFPSLSNDSTLDDTPPLTPNISSVTSDDNKSTGEEDTTLSADEIMAKIAALRKEKHNLFQLMKRLVEQEEEEEQQQQQKKLIQQKQQDLKKKKTSRWSSTTTPTSSSIGSFQKQHQQSSSPPPPSTRTPFNNKSLNSRSSSFHSTAKSNGYFGQQQRQPFSHRQPYLY